VRAPVAGLDDVRAPVAGLDDVRAPVAGLDDTRARVKTARSQLVHIVVTTR
jgi:hypothetical protein